MAENVNAGGGKLPNAQVLKTCLTRASKLDSDMTESRGELGQFIKEAEEKHNIHRKAFKLIRQLDRMDQTKLAEFLRHFDHYRDVVALDDKAGTDMFGDDETDGQDQEDLRPDNLKRKEAERQAAENSERLKDGIKRPQTAH